MSKKEGKDLVSYTLGIISIALAFFTPLAGLVLGIIGFVQSKKEKSDLSRRGRKLSLIGIVLSVILFIVSLIITLYLTTQQLGALPSFPIA